MKHLDSGAQVSHYRIERKLGAGGMGAVFLARDLTLDRLVAIKFLAEQDDERKRRRLLREAQAVAALDHECIAGVYEVGTDAVGGDFIVMQYVEGETLAARLKRGRLEPGEALTIAGRVAEALVAAHRRGIIHRDLKPQNIMLTGDGTPKLLDFGLAMRTIPTSADADAQTVTASVTTHAVYGTPSYMSPEQVRNKVADARSDVFALGCVLHECLTGKRAFNGDSSPEIFGAVLHVEPPPVSSIVPELSPSYDALCARMLKKKPTERFQSAGEALGAIQGLVDTSRLGPGAASDTQSAWHSRGWTFSTRAKWMTAIAGSVAIAVGAAAWQWYRGDVLPRPTIRAAEYFETGLAALRDGTYARARDNFTEALKYSPNYVQAHSGLAQALMELDDSRNASSAQLKVNELVPDRTRLPTDERLRLEAIMASVQRSHGVAIASYRELAERHPNDAGAWLDLGRAQEAAELRKEARAAYEKALALNPQSPAAQVRMGMLLVQDGQQNEAIQAYDEALRLYRLAGNVEGEAEAILRKVIALNNLGQLEAAATALREVVRLAGTQYVSQRVRAQFELARVAAQRGQPDDAVGPTEAAVREARDAGLHTIAANGLVDYANLFLDKDPVRADAELAKAMQLAADHGARRTEMRAQLQRMFIRSDQGKAEEAIKMAEAPLAFYGEGRYPMLEAVAKTVVSRAREALGDYDAAIQLSNDVLRYADEINDPALANDALQNLASQFAAVGRLPEAMAVRERSAKIYRQNNQFVFLASTLVQQAETLIVLGRPREAEPFILEVEALVADGSDTNVHRPRRLARLRALNAAMHGRFAEAERYAALARVGKNTNPDITDVSARAIAAYAAAEQGRRRPPADDLARWVQEASTPESRAELTYWVAQALQARGEFGRAHSLVESSWKELADRGGPELRWRLAALGATIPPRSAEDEIQKLRALWSGYDATPYFSRADLKSLLGKRR